LVAEEAGTHFAEEAHVPARRKLLHLARIEIQEPHPEIRRILPGVPNLLGRFFDQLHDQRAPRTVLHLGIDDVGLDQDRDAGARLFKRGEARLVLVAQRQMQREVELRADRELLEARGERGLRGVGGHPRCITASISTAAPRGSEATPTAARAGKGSRKYVAMISFTLAKLARSVRYTVTRTTWSKSPPPARHTACRLSKTRRAWLSKPSTIFMVCG